MKKAIITIGVMFILFMSYKITLAEMHQTAIIRMDTMEKHYDADGPLVMVDIENNMVGFYYCATSLEHFDCEIEYDKSDIGKIALVSNGVRYVSNKTEFVFPFTEDQLTWVYENIPNETPVVIY